MAKQKQVRDISDNIPDENLDNYNYCLCTITSDSFVKGTYVLIKSFLENNKWFNGDIIIFHEDKFSSISEDNKKLLSNNIDYPISFYKINHSNYKSLFNRFSKMPKFKKRLYSSIYTIESLNLINSYDKVLYLDSDIVVRHSLYNVFCMNNPVVVTPSGAGLKTLIVDKINSFNGAFLFLNKNDKINLSNIYHKMLKFEEDLNNINYWVADQGILNYYLHDYAFYIHKRFNAGKKTLNDKVFNKNFNNFDKKIKVVHYPGEKPWQKKHKEKDIFRKVEKIWHYYNDL